MNIKDYRDKELKMYLVACIFLLLCFTKEFSLNGKWIETVDVISKSIDKILVSASIYIFSYIVDSLISSQLKDKVVNLFGIIKKPGEQIFSCIKDNCKDDRISKERALNVYMNIYDKMPNDDRERRKYENLMWYDIYSKHREVTMIQVSNRDYLLCRDLFFATIEIFILYIGCVWMELINLNLRFIGFLVMMLIINNIATHVKAARFSYNVISYDLSKNNGKDNNRSA